MTQNEWTLGSCTLIVLVCFFAAIFCLEAMDCIKQDYADKEFWDAMAEQVRDQWKWRVVDK